ncbi:NADPH:quinone oxidoreductase family protein [Brevibacterium aurantiacum]|uniref:NADPH2:quinone reductase n=2 Tax=Brevibacterium aurantiacum TaxID=273384 RepID=A0A2H1KGI5_BREAU|nr:NADPH:quinone oxidoreductase family protein [Brevibacterium aurantiacum]PCC56676.1 NADPH:quinone oxidoreductase [Brevibacterium aurantiacum]SMX98688.1 NADPH2:quinone reductase [Brevibacterium aurantiacum]
MKAVQLNATDGPGSLALADVDIPSAGQGTVLIDVAYAGVTFPELLQSRGQYQMKPPLPYTMGSEVAGTVRDVGEGATGFAVGDRVVGVAGTGAYAEVMAVPASSVLPLPETVSLQAGAGMPMNLLTADFALRVRGRLEAGQSVLIHGAAGGLGSALVQVALAYGAEVIAVVSTQEKAETVTQLGAQHVVLADGFKTEVKEIFPRGVDLVADPVGGDRFTDSLRCLSPFGTLLVLGFTAGSIPEVKVNRLLLNNVSVAGVGWGAAVAVRPGMVAEQWESLWPHLSAGDLNPAVHTVLPLEKAGEALEIIDSRSVRGKVLLEVNGEGDDGAAAAQ